MPRQRDTSRRRERPPGVDERLLARLARERRRRLAELAELLSHELFATADPGWTRVARGSNGAVDGPSGVG
jgi:hypothetical protein